MFRATAGTIKVFAFNRLTGAPVLGDSANISCRFSLDGGARSNLASAVPVEFEDGYYLFSVSSAETNGTTVDFFPESSSANVQVIVVEHNRYLDFTMTALADEILKRSVSQVESTAPEHCLATVILAMLEHDTVGNVLTIRRSDGVTTHYTKTLTTNASANAITGIQ